MKLMGPADENHLSPVTEWYQTKTTALATHIRVTNPVPIGQKHDVDLKLDARQPSLMELTSIQCEVEEAPQLLRGYECAD